MATVTNTDSASSDIGTALITKTASSSNTSGTTSSGTATTDSITRTKRRLSILIIGGNGCIGQAIIHAGANHESQPLIHAFVRTPESLMAPYRFLCASIFQGDSRSPYEIANAIEEVKPDHIILCVGSNNSEGDEEDMDDIDFDLREASAISLVCALNETETDSYIRVTIFSTFVLKPFNRITMLHNPEVFDQRRQEETLISSFLGCRCLSHLLIIRMKRGVLINDTKIRNQIFHFELSNFRGRTNNKIILFPLKPVHRQDLAHWLLNRIHGPSDKFGGIFGLSANKVFL